MQFVLSWPRLLRYEMVSVTPSIQLPELIGTQRYSPKWSASVKSGWSLFCVHQFAGQSPLDSRHSEWVGLWINALFILYVHPTRYG